MKNFLGAFIFLLSCSGRYALNLTTDGVLHQSLLSADLISNSEFSFWSQKSSDCQLSSEIEISFFIGPAFAGSNQTKFSLYAVKDANSGADEMTEYRLKSEDAKVVRNNGQQFNADIKSLGEMSITVDGNRKISEDIGSAFQFANFNDSFLSMNFYAWFENAEGQVCSFEFEFPKYHELQENDVVFSTSSPPNDLLSNDMNSDETRATPPSKLPTTTTTPSTTSEEPGTSSKSFVLPLCLCIGCLFLGIIISGVAAYFILPKFSYFTYIPVAQDEVKADSPTMIVSTNKESTGATAKLVQNETDLNTASYVNKDTKTEAGGKLQTLNGVPDIASYQSQQ